MKKLRIAIIGCKNMGRKHLAVLREHFAEQVKIAGILNSTPESTAVAAAELGVPALESLEKINRRKVDAAIIATPAENHYQTAKVLLAKKIPLLIEKPFAANDEQCLALIKLAEKNNVPILIGHTENYNPAVLKLKELLTAPLKSIAAVRTSQTGDRRQALVISELMIHDLAIVNALLPGSWTLGRLDKNPEYRWDEHAVIELKYECGTIVRLEALRRPDSPVERRMRLIDMQNNIWQIDFLERRLMKNGEVLCASGNSLAAELEDFIRMATEGTLPLVSAEEARQTVALCCDLEAECS